MGDSIHPWQSAECFNHQSWGINKWGTTAEAWSYILQSVVYAIPLTTYLWTLCYGKNHCSNTTYRSASWDQSWVYRASRWRGELYRSRNLSWAHKTHVELDSLNYFTQCTVVGSPSVLEYYWEHETYVETLSLVGSACCEWTFQSSRSSESSWRRLDIYSTFSQYKQV